jgi:hypothetical protein
LWYNLIEFSKISGSILTKNGPLKAIHSATLSQRLLCNIAQLVTEI